MTQPPDPGPQYPPPMPPGYGYPPPGYGYGYVSPPPPPPRTNLKLWIGIGAGVLVVVVLLCLGSGFLLVHRAASDIERADPGPVIPTLPTVPNPLASLEAQQLHSVNPDDTPLAIGQTLTAEDGMGNRVRLTISRVRFQTKPCNAFSTLPKGMVLLIVDLTVQVDTGALRTTEFDFGLTVPGHPEVKGFEGMLSGCGTGLSPKTQRAGTTQRANLSFVTPAREGEIVYDPLLSPQPVGSWTFG